MEIPLAHALALAQGKTFVHKTHLHVMGNYMAGEKNCEVEALEQRCAQLENDMQKMQERLAWMDMTLNDTGKYIDTLLDRVDKLERQIKFLASMQDAPAAVRPLSEETPPPHY